MHFVATPYNKNLTRDPSVPKSHTGAQIKTILRGALKDLRVKPKSNKTSSYIEDHSEDILTREQSVP